MVNPLYNQQFSHDYQKFVFQDPSYIPLGPVGIPKSPFSLQSPKKAKKDLEKEKSPWLSKPKNSNENSTDV